MSKGALILCHDYFEESDRLATRAKKEFISENQIKLLGVKSKWAWWEK